MADSSRSRTSSAERNKTYKLNNPEAVKLNQLRFSVKVAAKRSADSDFDREYYREEEAGRKRKYRALAAEKSVAAARLAAAIKKKI